MRGAAPPAMPLSLGIWRYSGVCPPWKPGRVPLPERDFWPRMPNPQLPPCSAQTLLIMCLALHLLPAAWPAQVPLGSSDLCQCPNTQHLCIAALFGL